MKLVAQIKILLQIAFGILILFSTLPVNATNNITLHGVITDELNNPLAGTNIVLNPGEFGTITDNDGGFKFNNIPAQQYQLTASAVGYSKTSTTVQRDSLDKPIIITLTTDVHELREVEIKNNTQQKIKRAESISIQLIQEEFLKEERAATLMQTLKKIPGLNSIDAGTGISKPIIRGMSYYRVVVAQNGIKQEGQQWSSHHGLCANQHAVDHVEVIKGPASLQYGSDAIGGVLNIMPEHVPLTSGVIGEISVSAKSNTEWLGGSGNISFRKKDWYGHINLGYTSYGDFTIPETDSYLLPAPVSALEASHPVLLGKQVHNTAGSEQAISVLSGIVKPWGNSYMEFSYCGNKTGFFDWQGLRNDSMQTIHSHSKRDLNFPWQVVNNYTIKHITNRYYGSNKLALALGYQNHSSSENDFLTDRTGNRSTDLEYYRKQGSKDLGMNLQTGSGNLMYTINKSEKQQFKLGINTQYQHHSIDGYNHILPYYYRSSGGIFTTFRKSLTEKWIANVGARIDLHHLNMRESNNTDPEYGDAVFNPSFQKYYTGTALSAGFNYLPNSTTTYKINIGKSYRVPSVYELGAYGLHRHEGRFEKGNINNNPEQAWQLDLNLDTEWNKLNLAISPFATYFTNYLYLNPTAELRPEGQVYEYRQTRAMLTGGEVFAKYSLTKNVAIQSGAEYVYAINLDLKKALPFTPPLSVLSEIAYQFKSHGKFVKRKISFEWVHAASQNYTVPNELDTPGYNCFNIKATTDIRFGKQTLSVMLKVRNITNAKYYNHTSFYRRLRIPEPGRDIQLFINVPF